MKSAIISGFPTTICTQSSGPPDSAIIEHFQAKRMPVRVKKMRQNKDLEMRHTSKVDHA
jgi:hypothetical protein